MQKLSTELLTQIEVLTETRTSFALVRRPNGESYLFSNPQIDGPIAESGPYFRISPWNKGPWSFPRVTHDEYIGQLRQLMKSFGPALRKVVFSRTTCGTLDTSMIVKKAIRYFNCFPSALCFLYYTDETGFWLGASPELLLKDNGNGYFSTMALAGTRLSGTDAPWDSKNKEEHAYVVDFISRVFSECGLTPAIGHTGTLNYGKIEHLHTSIDAIGDVRLYEVLLKRLSPTPALCGTPRDAARHAIDLFEHHSRGCYGGYIDFRFPDSDIREAYVNLRCACIGETGDWCVFSGGGIIAGSDPESEWIETERKAETLVNILSDKG